MEAPSRIACKRRSSGISGRYIHDAPPAAIVQHRVARRMLDSRTVSIHHISVAAIVRRPPLRNLHVASSVEAACGLKHIASSRKRSRGNPASSPAGFPILWLRIVLQQRLRIRVFSLFLESRDRSHFLLGRIFFTRTGIHFARKCSGRPKRFDVPFSSLIAKPDQYLHRVAC